MSTASTDDLLRRLDEKELEVLFWKCRDKTREEIGAKMNYGEDMIQVFSTRMYNKLEFDPKLHHSKRKKLLDEEYCPALNSYGRTPAEIAANLHASPAPVNPDPQVGSAGWMIVYEEKAIETVREEFTDQIRALQLRPPAPIITVTPKPLTTKKTFPWYAIALVALLVAGGFLAGRWPTLFPAAPNPLPSPVTLFPSETPSTAPKQAIVASQAPTTAPSPTPGPTVKPTQIVLFADDFNNGLSDQWIVVSGEPMVVDGKLTSTSGLTLEVGDNSWMDYQMQVHFYNWGCHGPNWSYLGVHAKDAQNMVALFVCSCEMSWQTISKGQGSTIPNSGAGRTDRPDQLVRVTAKGDTFQAEGGTAFTVEGYPSGKVILILPANISIDDFKVIPQ